MLRWLPQVHDVRRLLHQLAQNLPTPEPPDATLAAARFASPAAEPRPGGADLVSQLQRLSERRAAGHLTEDEFNAAKQQLLGGAPDTAT